MTETSPNPFPATTPKPAIYYVGITIGVILVVLVLGWGIKFLWGKSAGNYANRSEKGIIATYEDNKNYLSNYYVLVGTAAKIPQQYMKDLKDLVQAEMTARYGNPDTRKGNVMNWIQERQLDVKTISYERLMSMIESGRNEFTNRQSRLLDQKREYETALENWPGGGFMRDAGYPKINLAEYKIVITQETSDTFETGIEKPQDIFSTK